MASTSKKTIGIFLHALHYGGIEKFVETHREVYNPQVNDCHIIVNRAGVKKQEEYFESLGFKLHLIPMKSPKSITRQAKVAYKRLFRDINFDVVHCNLPTNVLPLQYAQKAGVPRKVLHSHSNYYLAIDKKPVLVQAVYRYLMERNADRADVCLACSQEAAKVFGKNEQRTKVVNDSIDFNTFAFNAEDRVAIRLSLGIAKEATVFCHVGRMENDIKNHFFLLDVFKAYATENPSAKLILVGDGKKRTEFEAYAAHLGVSNACFFVGTTNNVSKYLSAADMFLFPSKSEGLGISLVEAQAAGLPCVASNTVPYYAKFTDTVTFAPIDTGIEPWVCAIRSLLQRGRTELTDAVIKASGYSVDSSSCILNEAFGFVGE